MTVVVGFNWYSEMLILADTRVSWLDRSRSPQDVLQKLYIITDLQKTAVIGFSGRLSAAKTIISYLRENKFKYFKRRLIMATLKDNLRSWIEEVAKSHLSPEERKSLEFMLCGLETYRPPFSTTNTGKVLVSHLINPEVHLYVYRISSETGKVNVINFPDVAVIGAGKSLRHKISSSIHESIHLGFNQPNLYWARTLLVTQRIAELFKDSEYDMTVGGPFQTIQITPNGFQEYYTWPPDLEYLADVKIVKEDEKTILYNPNQDKRYTLYPIWSVPLS